MSKCVFDYGEDMCYAVTEKQCEGCKFRKTEKELQEGRDKATKRLMTLDRLRLNKIKQKYYNDRRRRDERV
jgi:hypothetical protein